MNIEPEALIGHDLTHVSSSWHEVDGERSKEPVHVWLSVADVGTLRLHTLSGLVVTVDEVGTPADMGEYGSIVVESNTPAVLSERVGECIEGVSRLRQDPPGAMVGFSLHFRGAAVGIADLGDELIVAEWPASDWKHWGVSIEEEH